MRLNRLSLLVLVLPFPGFAGDCFSHSMFIHDTEIHSCEVVSETNANEVSHEIASPKVIAEQFPGIILKGQVKAVRQIDLNEPLRDIKFLVHPWKSTDEHTIFLYLGKLVADGCSAFRPNTHIKFASYTNCECDTGPRATGYCAIRVTQVTDIPSEHLQHAE